MKKITIAALSLGLGIAVGGLWLAGGTYHASADPLLPATPTVSTSAPTMMPSQPATSSVSSPFVPVAPAPPVQVTIPSVSINAPVASLVATQDASGAYGLYPPEATWSDFLQSYWWSQRGAPGYPATKTTYILGHTCHSSGCPAVFNNLQQIAIGAQVLVTTQNGTLTYQVDKVATYAKSSIAPVVNAPDEPNSLVLITCKLRGLGQATVDNFVVWTTLVGSQPAASS